MIDRKPRIYMHPDGRYVSIGFEGTNDTLLKVTEDVREGWRDVEVVREWVEAISRMLSDNSLEDEWTTAHGMPDTEEGDR